MSKNWVPLIFVVIALWVTGCSSSPTSEEGQEGGDANPVADAGTDAVPQDSAETPPPITNELGTPAGTPPAEVAAAPEPSPSLVASLPDLPPPMAAPEVAPSPAPAPVAEVAHSSASGSGISSHKIGRGDTLMKIAFRVYGDLFRWKEIYEANKDKISNPNSLPVGVELNIQDATPVKISKRGERYEIREGDTLGSISQDVYGSRAKWKRIWKNNKVLIRNPNKIFAGFHIYYTMTDQDREELENTKGSAPLAENVTPENPDRGMSANLGSAVSRSPASMPSLSMPSMPQSPAAPPVANANTLLNAK